MCFYFFYSFFRFYPTQGKIWSGTEKNWKNDGPWGEFSISRRGKSHKGPNLVNKEVEKQQKLVCWNCVTNSHPTQFDGWFHTHNGFAKSFKKLLVKVFTASLPVASSTDFLFHEGILYFYCLPQFPQH